MKHDDIQRLHAAGLISEEQRQRIIAHFNLKEDSSRMLTVLLILGATLAATGLVLLVAANWEEIPRLWKVALGLALMLGAYGGGYYLREVRDDYRRTGEALFFLGAGLFLANIALVGQIYHLASRLPNALLLWWVGIAALPWVLRSTALHVASLIAFSIWFGGEVFSRDGWLYFGGDATPLAYIGLLGLVFYGVGTNLRLTAWAPFAAPTERLGLLGFFGILFLFSIGPLTEELIRPTAGGWVLVAVMAGAGLGLVGVGVSRAPVLTRQWRVVWILTLTVGAAVMAVGLIGGWKQMNETGFDGFGGTGLSYLAVLVLFVSGLIAIQTGLSLASPYLVNLGMAFIALDITATYLTLLGSMAHTGLVFVVSGVFLIAFGTYLEKKRRTLLRRIHQPIASTVA